MKFHNCNHTNEGNPSSKNVKRICPRCAIKTYGIVGQEVEEFHHSSLPSQEIATKIKDLVNENVKIEDIAVICVHQILVEQLKIDLKSYLTGRNGLKHLNIVSAEEFANKCSKIPKSRKRNADGVITQKRFLAIDSVRRFKGLEAKVNNSFCLIIIKYLLRNIK